METIDAEYIPLIQTDENNDDSVYEDTETFFSHGDNVNQQEATSVELRRREKVAEKLDSKVLISNQCLGAPFQK